MHRRGIPGTAAYATMVARGGFGVRIGSVTVDPPVVLAPMAGVTAPSFRQISKEQGAGLVVAEMVSAQGLVRGNARSLEFLEVLDGEHPMAIQLFGSDPDALRQAAAMAEDAGADIVDLNFGCPVPKITRNGDGSALMRDPDRAVRCAKAAVSGTRLPVTVKCRAGWDRDSVNAPELCKKLEDVGVMAVTVHGRTRSDGYREPADWNVIRAVKAAVSIPVIGNGDVVAPEDVVRLMAETGCDGVAVARGALGNPWFFAEARARLQGESEPEPVSAAQRLSTLMRHVDLQIQRHGEGPGIREMRKQMAYYLRGIPGSAEVRGRLNAAETRAQLVALLVPLGLVDDG